MQYVDQLSAEQLPPGNKGDCLSACIASILEVRLDQVPHFTGKNWREEIDRFLATYGLCLIGYMADGEAFGPPPFYHIVSGLSSHHKEGESEVDNQHAVVCYGEHMVHDPSSSRTGLKDMQYRWMLLPRTGGIGGRPGYRPPLTTAWSSIEIAICFLIALELCLIGCML